MNRPKNIIWLLLGITLIGGILRVWYLGEKSFWIDELISLCHAESINDVTTLFTPTCGNAHPPLYFLLVKGWSAFGDGEFHFRLLSAIFGTAVIPGVFFLGRELVGRAPALVSTFIAAVSPFYLLYDREVRMYSLLTCLSIWSLYFFIKALKNGRSIDWVLYTVLSVMNVYVHYHAFLVLLLEWIFFFSSYPEYRTQKLRALLSQVVIIGAFLFWLPNLLYQIQNPAKFALDAPDKFPIFFLVWIMKPLYVLSSFSLGQTILPWNPVAILGAILFSVLGVLGVRRLLDKPETLRFLSLSLVVPFVAASFISDTMPRYFVFLAPLYFFIIAEGFFFWARRWVQACLFLVFLFPMLVSANNYYNNREFHILAHVDPWREVSVFIRKHAQPEDCLVTIGAARPIGYYLKDFEGFSKPIYGTNYEESGQCMDKGSGRRLWVVTGDSALKKEAEAAQRWLDTQFVLLADRRFFLDSDYQMKTKLFKKDFLEYRISVFLYGKT